MSLTGVADAAGGLRGGRGEAVLTGPPVGGPWGHPYLYAWPRGHRGACLGHDYDQRVGSCVGEFRALVSHGSSLCP